MKRCLIITLVLSMYLMASGQSLTGTDSIIPGNYGSIQPSVTGLNSQGGGSAVIFNGCGFFRNSLLNCLKPISLNDLVTSFLFSCNEKSVHFRRVPHAVPLYGMVDITGSLLIPVTSIYNPVTSFSFPSTAGSITGIKKADLTGTVSGNTRSTRGITAPLCETYAIPFGPETFDAGSFPPLCWTRNTGLLAAPSTLTATSLGWQEDAWSTVAAPLNKAAKLKIHGTACNYWLTTPQVNLGAGSPNLNLEFDLVLSWRDPSLPPPPPPCWGTSGSDDKFAVVISTDGGTTWTSANTLRLWDNAGSPYVYDNINFRGEHVTISLAGYSGTIMIGFYGESMVSNTENDLMIDNVKIFPYSSNKTLTLTAFLESLYGSDIHAMRKAQDSDGENTSDRWPGTTADTISVLLARCPSDFGTYFWEAHGLIVNSDGTIEVALPASITGDYYIIVKHRTSVETWSAYPVSFGGDGPFIYDFTDDPAKAYGDNQKEVEPGVWAILCGDVSSFTDYVQDGYVDISDVQLVNNAGRAFQFGYRVEDVNGDGFVDISDVQLVNNNSTKFAGVLYPCW